MSDDARLDDYLNDKLQTVADFDALDSLIAAVQTQQSLLQQQVWNHHPLQTIRLSSDVLYSSKMLNETLQRLATHLHNTMQLSCRRIVLSRHISRRLTGG